MNYNFLSNSVGTNGGKCGYFLLRSAAGVSGAVSVEDAYSSGNNNRKGEGGGRQLLTGWGRQQKEHQEWLHLLLELN